MAHTTIAGVQIPEWWADYVLARTSELSAFWQSGIVVTNSELQAKAQAGGELINFPFWSDLDGDDALDPSGGNALEVEAITSGLLKARRIERAKAWGVEDLAVTLAGSDPLQNLADRVAAYWARRKQTSLINILTGIFGADGMDDLTHDITDESGTDAVFSAEAFIDAAFKLGDAEGKLAAVGVHSATYSTMLKQDLIDFVPDSAGGKDIPNYLGKRVIVDDGLPVGSGGTAGEYTTYLFGPGAFGYGDGNVKVPFATERDELKGQEHAVSRQHFYLAPVGMKWLEASVEGDSPTNAELATAANWDMIFSYKDIPIVKFVHKLTAVSGS